MTAILMSRGDMWSLLEESQELLARAYKLAEIHGQDSDELGVEARSLMNDIKEFLSEIEE